MQNINSCLSPAFLRCQIVIKLSLSCQLLLLKGVLAGLLRDVSGLQLSLHHHVYCLTFDEVLSEGKTRWSAKEVK